LIGTPDSHMTDFFPHHSRFGHYGWQSQHSGHARYTGMIVGQIGGGLGIDDLLKDYPCLKRQDILQALRYAAWLAQDREIDLAATHRGCR